LRLSLFFLGWAVLYLFLQGQDGFFARTVEQVDGAWLRWTVLNVPLHLALTVVVLGCAAARRRWIQRAGVAVASANAGLILAHIVLSFATA
jgi:hypothetical protein